MPCAQGPEPGRKPDCPCAQGPGAAIARRSAMRARLDNPDGEGRSIANQDRPVCVRLRAVGSRARIPHDAAPSARCSLSRPTRNARLRSDRRPRPGAAAATAPSRRARPASARCTHPTRRSHIRSRSTPPAAAPRASQGAGRRGVSGRNGVRSPAQSAARWARNRRAWAGGERNIAWFQRVRRKAGAQLACDRLTEASLTPLSSLPAARRSMRACADSLEPAQTP